MHAHEYLKHRAEAMGFMSCVIAKADFLEEEAAKLESWLSNGYHGKMSYLERHFDKRLDPRKLVPGAKSVVVLAYNYFPEKEQNLKSYKLAKYAYGQDYHQVIKEKLRDLVADLKQELGDFHCRVFTDSAPVLERAWAQKGGMGWIGKHGLLLRKSEGSFFFLAEIITDLELQADPPYRFDHCGTCTRCIDACPTEAIIADQVLDASKCISYLTIELKGDIPSTFEGQFEDWMFGCDICQDVCPWNRFSKPHEEKAFLAKEGLLEKSKEDWNNMGQELFEEIFKGSAVQRTGYAGLKRNLEFLGR